MRTIISETDKETKFYKSHIIKYDVECSCYSCDCLPNIDHKNCPCHEKYQDFYNNQPRTVSDKQIILMWNDITNYGPCLHCKGTGRVTYTETQKQMKFLCVNGPLEGQRITKNDMLQNYSLYNASTGADKKYKAVWVYLDSLND